MSITGERRAQSTDSAILEMVRRRTETTRVDIARELGVTPATVTYAVKRLLAADLVVETGFAQSRGGKRASLLRLNDRARWAIGCTIDADRISVVGVDMTGALRSRVVLPRAVGAADSGEAGADEVIDLLRKALAMMEPDRAPHATTGIGFAITQAAGDSAPELLETISKALPYPTVSASSRTCAALGSFWSGEQPERGLTATVHMDGGLGLAVLLDGTPLPTSPAASLDHVCVDPNGAPCACGGRGCLHQYASTAAIVQAAEAEGLAGPLGFGGTEQSRLSDAVLLALAASRGDARARSILEGALTALAQACWASVGALGIRSIVLSGASLQAAPGIVRRTVGDYFAARSGRDAAELKVHVSQVQPHPGSVGAAVLALQTFMDPGSR